MATVYSLVCFGGLSGKTVTFTDTGDVVNLTNHGLRQGVTGIVFSSTGSLPTGITSGTTYYPRDGADANKFTIYPTGADALAGTNQITFSGTGSGTHTVKSAYMLGLTTEELSRYGDSGSERVYNGLSGWKTGRSAALETDLEICEIGEAFDEAINSSIGLAITSAGSSKITPRINGVLSSGFHYGDKDKGYRAIIKTSYVKLSLTSKESVIEGFHIKIYEGITDSVCLDVGYSCEAVNMILSGSSTTSRNSGLRINSLGKARNILVYGVTAGVTCIDYASGYFLQNALITKCSQGVVKSQYSSTAGYFYNVVSIGNTTNWSSSPTGILGARNNAGLSGEPWYTGTEISTYISDTSPYTSTFVDWANEDFRLCSGSVLIDSGTDYYQRPAIDIAGNERLAYAGGVDESVDIGPYEYELGYGPHPLQVTIAIFGITEGSVLAVYKTNDGTTIVSPTTIGAAGSHSITYSYTGDTQITVVVRKGTSGTKYLPYTAPGLITSSGFALIVNQVVDGVLNG